MKPKIILLCFILLFGFFCFNGAAESDLEQIFNDTDEITVLVQLKDLPLLQTSLKKTRNQRFDAAKERIRMHQDRVIDELNISQRDPRFLQRKEKLRLERSFSNVNALQLRVSQEGLLALMNDPNIQSVHLPRSVSKLLIDTKEQVNASATWRLIYNNSNLTGLHQSVCVIDTGVDYTHSRMGNCSQTSNINDRSCAKVIGGYDFVNDDANPIDDDGHGTHVAGIVASTDTTYRGIAPDSKIVALKMLDEDGGGNDADLIAAIDWCVSNATILNISVITMSLGGSIHYSGHCDDNDNETLVAQAIEAAISRNITVIAAAGNSGLTTGIVSPACIRNVTAVSWVTKANVLAGDRNNLTDLVAPGTSIASLKASTADPGCSDINSLFTSCSGSSMAAPHAAGAAALLHQYGIMQMGRRLMPNETQSILNSTGKLIIDSGGSNLHFSRINLFSAIQSIDLNSPTVSLIHPSNNSVRNNISFFVRVNASETLANAFLEVNGTNTSMTETAQIWRANITFLRNGSYSFRIYSNDSFGNTNNQLFSILIDQFAPTIGPGLSNQNPIYNETIQINISANDTTSISSFIFCWNQSGNFSNETIYFGSGQHYNLSINKTINRTKGNVIGMQFFVNDSANNFNASGLFLITVANALPQSFNVSVNSSDPLNRTNGTLSGVFSYFDQDGDGTNGTDIRWYKNGIEQASLRNLTGVSFTNTTKNEVWNFSVRVFDGSEYSPFVNTSITIRNSAPSINISVSSIVINETQTVNITINASDPDFDPMNFSINDSRFFNQSIYFIWNTNLSNLGMYSVNITVNDSQEIDWHVITIQVQDARDLDSDGNPDFNDSDDDNDAILDLNDFVLGNISNVNTTLSLNISINHTSNASKLFNGTFLINISNGTRTFIEFNFTFNSTNTFDFGSLTINKSLNGSSAIAIRGINLSTSTFKKTITLDKRNLTADSVCILDAEKGFDQISSACNSADELLLSCDNSSNNGYSCLDDGSFYIVTNLGHSAIKEQCRDVDGDSYGTGCLAGSDCDDSDSSKTTSCPSGGSGGSGGGGGGGSGGGGGGSASKPIIYDKTQTYAEVSPDTTILFLLNKNNLAVDSISFAANKKLPKVTLKIRDLEENETEPFDGLVYQYLEITSEGMKEEDIASTKILFSVNTSWLRDNGINESSVLLLRLENKSWYPLMTHVSSSNETKTAFESVTPGFSDFVIAALRTKTNISNRSTISNESKNASSKSESMKNEAYQAEEQTSSERKRKTIYRLFLLLVPFLFCVWLIHAKKKHAKKRH